MPSAALLLVLSALVVVPAVADEPPAEPPPPEARPGPPREYDDQGFRVRVDVAGQVLRLSIPEDRGFGERGSAEVPVLPTLPTDGDHFVSASVLGQKAKQFDDGLYAAVELAAQRGAGRFGGKAAMLEALARALAASGADRPGTAAPIVFAACRLGGIPVGPPPPLGPTVESYTRTFLADPLRARPLGFYTWSAALADIFRQDRMLQSELIGAGGTEALVRALYGHPDARKTYEGYLRLVSRLTNPSDSPDLRGLLAQLDSGRLDAPGRGLALVPASRSHEADLVMRLFGDRPIPAGFSLADELMRRIESGDLDLTPTGRSGWYDHQAWSLEPLAAPRRTPEANRLDFDASYREQLRALFKGLLALARETHVKQLEVPPPGDAAPGDEKEPVFLDIRPSLEAEPLATHYLRRAGTYRFIRSVLEETFGPEGLKALHRQTAAGPVAVGLDAELSQMQALYRGAYVTTCRRLGIAPEPDPGREDGADLAAFRRWAAAPGSDPDLARDARMMVPVFFDRGRGKTKVWAFLGWDTRRLDVGYREPPAVVVTRDGRPVSDPKVVAVRFQPEGHRLAYPVTAEVYVDRLLDRDEFRRLCDRYKTRTEILRHLK